LTWFHLFAVDIVKGNARSKTGKRKKLVAAMEERLHALFYDIMIFEKKAADKKINPEAWRFSDKTNSFKHGSTELYKQLKEERKKITESPLTNAKAKREAGKARLKRAKYNTKLQ